MRSGSRQTGAVLTLLSFALAFAQRPGEATADTKVHLHVDPVRFLSDVAEVWSSSGGLGHIQAGQYSGYLWPMGPFFALGDLVGLAPWVVHRLWVGLLLAVAAWGVVALLDATLERPSRFALLIAGVLFVVNPYVTTFTQATSVTLLGYATLPWLMLAVKRGLCRPAGWWWPALFALVLASTGGGVNAAVTAWLLLGPLLLLGYEWRTGAIARSEAWSFAWRTGLLSVAASAWWVVPVAVHAALGVNFLPFTESAGAIWATTSLPESLRLMGYWLSYVGVGFGADAVAYFAVSHELLFSTPVVLASLLVPALAVAGLVWTHRLRHAPFFLALLLVGLIVMSAGFPEGTPLRRALTRTYNEVEAVQFLRTTYKAGPLVALALAWLGGAAGGELWRRLRAPRARTAAAVAGVALVAVASWPLVTGRALDPEFTFEEVPDGWRDAADHVDRTLGANARGLVLPGQHYAFYEWGATVDPILPALAERPVGSRTAVPYSDLHGVDALWTLDGSVQQERLVPGQLRPLLRWLAVGQVVTGTDDDEERSGGPAPAEAERALTIAGLRRPAAEFGPKRRFAPDRGSLTEPRLLPRTRAYDVAGAGLVRLESGRGGTLLEGSAEGVTALAAFDRLDPALPLEYAGDQADADLREAIAAASELVVTDSNRRRIIAPARPRQTWGRTLQADEPVPADAPMLDPFAHGGTRGRTVAVVRGADYLRSPFAPGFPQFPEHRPIAAFDGDAGTYWEADRELSRSERWVEIGFREPRDVPWLELLPRRQQATRVTAVEVNGMRFPVEEGWNRLEAGLADVTSLRVRIADRDLPEGRHGGPGAIAEIRVPGLRLEEVLRAPRRVEDAARAVGVSGKAITYVFTRSTGDRPFRRHAVFDPDAGAVPDDRSVEAPLVREAADAEREIVRSIAPPEARGYRASGWVSVAPDAADPALDRLAGYRGGTVFRSSNRYEGRAGVRASKAFDGEPGTAWVGRAVRGVSPWIEWRTRAPRTVESLRLQEPPGPAVLPEHVRVTSGRTRTAPLAVAADGTVQLPRPVAARVVRIEAVTPPYGAVGIGEVTGAGVPRAAIPRRGALRGSCGDVRVRADGMTTALRVVGQVERLDAAFPLRARGCGPLRLDAGRQTVRAAGETLLPYLIELRSTGSAAAEGADAPGAVTDPGEGTGSSRDGVTVTAAEGARIVLGESFSDGWRATCDGRSLGAPAIASGWANGWDLPPGCSRLAFEFSPQLPVDAGYIASGAACVLLLILLLARRGMAAPRVDRPVRAPAATVLRGRPFAAAVLAAVLAAAAIGFVFALRAGAVAFPLLTLLFWRGASAGRLLGAAAGLLLVAVPALYLLFPPRDLGGYNSGYAGEALAAHWTAVAAFVLLALALWRLIPSGAARAAAAGSREGARRAGS